MPQRKIPLVNDQYYHIFNRTIHKEPLFTKIKDCDRAITTLDFYRFANPPLRLSYYLAFGQDKRNNIRSSFFESSKKLVEIIAFCLMPNHFHLLLKQIADGGISKFLAQFQNSYTKYFNTKYARDGHLFRGQFKAIRIEDDNQLLHVQRYVHLNPYTSFVVKNLKDLEDYPYSSLREYLGKPEGFCGKEIILSHFSSVQSYKRFIFDQADYQRKLEEIKHLILE